MLSFISCLTSRFCGRIGQLCTAVLSSEEDPSLIRELWNYFIDKYFTARFEDYNYQYISFNSEGFFSVQEVAKKCGFDDASYFVRFFKKQTGLTPCEFKKQI